MRIAAAALLFVATPAAADTLIIGNKGENSVSFVDLATGEERGRAPSGAMPHEVAVSPDGAEAAVVAYGGTSIDIYDVAKAERLRTISIAPYGRPHGLVWLADGRLVATAEGSNAVAVVAADGAVSGVQTDQPGSHMIAVTPDARRAFVANIPAGTVSVIDLSAMRKLRDITVGGMPEGIALTVDGRELWVGDLSAPRVQAFDATSFARLGEVAVEPVPIRVVASPDGRWIATSNIGAGTISLIDPRTRTVVRTIRVSGEKAAEQVTILFSADAKRLYAAETGRDTVAEIDVEAGTVLRRLPAGRQGDGLAISPV